MIINHRPEIEDRSSNQISDNDRKFKIFNESVEDETKRFVKHSPLVSLLLMSLGPLSNLVSAVLSTVEMLFITKRFNQIPNSYATEILGFSNQYQTLTSLAGIFFSQCFVTRVSSLIGMGDRDEAAHLTSDIFRFTFVFSWVTMIPLYFIIKPILIFVGTPDEMMTKAFNYNFFMLLFVPFSNLFVSVQSYFQSIGKVIFMAIIVTLSSVVQTFILSPFILFICKASTTLMKLSKAIVDIIFSFLLLGLIYSGKFSLKPSIKQFFSFKFSKSIWKSLLYPLPIVFGFLGAIIPPMLVLSCLTSQNQDPAIRNAIGTVFAVFTELYSVCHALPSAIAVGFLTTGNHSYGSKNFTRFKKILIWALVISIGMGILFSFIFSVFNKSIAAMFIDDDETLEVSNKLLPIPFYTSFQQSFNIVIYSILLILKKPLLSVIPSVSQIVILCGGSFILKSKFEGDYVKIMHVYNIADIFCLVVDIALFIYLVTVLRKEEHARTDETLSTSLEAFLEPNLN